MRTEQKPALPEMCPSVTVTGAWPLRKGCLKHHAMLRKDVGASKGPIERSAAGRSPTWEGIPTLLREESLCVRG